MKTSGHKIWIDRRAVGRQPRVGEIVEVLGEPGHVRYRVRWEDGRETVVYPGPVPKPKPKRQRRKSTSGAKALPLAGLRATMTAAPGDRLVIRAHRLGEPEHDAEILDALGAEGGPPFRVRWEETGDESLYFPGPDAYVEHLAGGSGEAKRPRRRQGG
jgi:hypothetical protein